MLVGGLSRGFRGGQTRRPVGSDVSYLLTCYTRVTLHAKSEKIVGLNTSYLVDLVGLRLGLSQQYNQGSYVHSRNSTVVCSYPYPYP